MLLKTDNLTKHFHPGRNQTLHAVDGVSLEISKNETLGLVGESGSGKSTLGKTLVGLLGRTPGQVYFEEELLPRNLSAEAHLRFSRKMQMIFQDPYSSLNPRMTILDIIGEGLYIQGSHKKDQIRELVSSWLIKVGLEPDHMSRYPHEFSGGQRQRICIARALSLKPELIICDESVSALDVSVQAQVLNLLKNLQLEFGLTYIFISHDLSVVKFMSDMMAVMNAGKFVEFGPSESIYANPKEEYTRRLIDAIPRDNLDQIVMRQQQREEASKQS